MLADEILLDLCAGSGCDIGPVVPRIKRAHKFVLTPEFAAVAEALSADYGGLLRVFPQCRLPYADVWFEVLQDDRPHFMASGMHIPQLQAKPKRVGFLLTATRADLSAWKAHLFWSIEGHGTSTSLAATTYDMAQPIYHYSKGDLYSGTDDTPVQIGSIRIERFGSHPGWEGATDDIRLALANHSGPVPADCQLLLSVLQGIPPAAMLDFIRLQRQLARADWAGEGTFLLAVVGLLNARNAVETVAVDQGKLNRARVKRGKAPLLDHKILKIAQRQVQRVYPDGERHPTHAPMRGHFCRGHFKARKTGIFFWHPHARGHFSKGTVTKDYRL